MYRHIIEQSDVMINNDEVIIYLKTPLTEDEVHKKGHRLVMVRPVFSNENLNISYRGSFYDELNISEMTLFLDAYYKMKRHFNFWMSFSNASIENQIALFIGSAYYDCLSGGMPKFEITILRYLIEQEKLNLDTQVYPEGDKWDTLKDWIEKVKDVPKFEDFIKEFSNKLPLLPKLLEA